MNEPRAVSVSFLGDTMCVHLNDGRALRVPLSSFPRLLRASAEQRAAYLISAAGLHWDALDEDISVMHLLTGCGDRHAAALLDEHCRKA
jgi:hypothetical protein